MKWIKKLRLKLLLKNRTLVRCVKKEKVKAKKLYTNEKMLVELKFRGKNERKLTHKFNF